MREEFSELARRVAEAAEQMRPTLEAASKLAEEIARQTAPMLKQWADLKLDFMPIQIKAMELISPTLEKFAKAEVAHARMIAEAARPEPIAILPSPIPYHTAPASRDEIADIVIQKLRQEGVIPERRRLQEEREPLIPLPQNSRFEDLSIAFVDNYTVTIHLKNELIGKYDYESLGFCRKNTADKIPDNQWKLLTQLAIALNHKEFKLVTSTDLLAAQLKVKRNAFLKTKSALAKKLSEIFGLKEDPFHPYDSAYGYKVKFALKPVPILRGTGELHSSGGQLYAAREDIRAEDQYE